MTTGHEWNGIKELKLAGAPAGLFFLAVTALFAVVYWVLMPAWPLGVTYTKGLLGIDQRNIVTESVKQAALERGVWTMRIEAESFKDIQADPRLTGTGAADRPDAVRRQLCGMSWIERKGRQGIPNRPRRPGFGWRSREYRGNRSGSASIRHIHRPGCRKMMAFGRDQLLKKDEVDNVVNYVRSLFRPCCRKGRTRGELDAGKAVFHRQLRHCHGDDAKGKVDLGGPDLTDRFWIYGGDAESISTTVWAPARPYAELGRTAVAARSQDSCALSVSIFVGATMMRERKRRNSP